MIPKWVRRAEVLKWLRFEWMTARLLPCPFCGARPYVLIQKVGYLVCCQVCPARMLVTSKYQRQVVAEWNHRTITDESH